MATIYTKTALKKIKKDALIEMFLELQSTMDWEHKWLDEKKELLKQNEWLSEWRRRTKDEVHPEWRRKEEEMKEEIESLKKDLEAKNVDRKMDEVVEKYCKDAVEEVVGEAVEGMKDVIKEVQVENETLKKDLEAAEHTIQHSNSTWQKSYEKLEKENEKLKGKLQDIKDHYDLGHLANEWKMNDDFSITLDEED